MRDIDLEDSYRGDTPEGWGWLTNPANDVATYVYRHKGEPIVMVAPLEHDGSWLVSTWAVDSWAEGTEGGRRKARI